MVKFLMFCAEHQVLTFVTSTVIWLTVWISVSFIVFHFISKFW